MITTHSKSKHYDPETPEADISADRGLDRDEVGLIRSICVKVSITWFWRCIFTDMHGTQARSSAKRKQMFADIQSRGGVAKPLQLLIDMPVRWSSTYVMTSRAEATRSVCVLLHIPLNLD